MIENYLNIIFPVQGLRCVAHRLSKGPTNATSVKRSWGVDTARLNTADLGAGEGLAARLIADQAFNNVCEEC